MHIRSMGMEGMGDMEGMDPSGRPMRRSDALGGDAGDVTYPLYVLDGRGPAAPASFYAIPASGWSTATTPTTRKRA